MSFNYYCTFRYSGRISRRLLKNLNLLNTCAVRLTEAQIIIVNHFNSVTGLEMIYWAIYFRVLHHFTFD